MDGCGNAVYEGTGNLANGNNYKFLGYNNKGDGKSN